MYYNYECYNVFTKELVIVIGEAVVVVILIHLLMTADFITTFMVFICVTLCDFFLLGLLPFWDVKLNSVTVVNTVIAIGLAVDYSAHIAHAYLQAVPPEKNAKG